MALVSTLHRWRSLSSWPASVKHRSEMITQTNNPDDKLKTWTWCNSCLQKIGLLVVHIMYYTSGSNGFFSPLFVHARHSSAAATPILVFLLLWPYSVSYIHVSYSAASYLFGAFKHDFLRHTVYTRNVVKWSSSIGIKRTLIQYLKNPTYYDTYS